MPDYSPSFKQLLYLKMMEYQLVLFDPAKSENNNNKYLWGTAEKNAYFSIENDGKLYMNTEFKSLYELQD